MPTYDYRCKEHGIFEKVQRMKNHARANCPTCSSDSSQILTRPPGLDIEGMARAGLPSAYETVGDRITKRHTSVPQYHRP